jgi:hypothetical protein
LRALEGVKELEEEGTTTKTAAHFRPYHFVLLALSMSRRNIQRFSMQGYEANVVQYACRMHLWKALGLEPPADVRERDHRGRFRPLTALNDPETVETVSDDLASLFQDSGAESVRSISGAVSELVDNCYSHSDIGAGLRGFVCAQRWPNGNKAQIAIGDSGVGIRHSLSAIQEHRDALQRENSCELATRYSVSSKLGKNHAGYGLTLARDLIANNAGAFFLVSGDEYYACKRGADDRGALPSHMPGTLAIIEWNTHVPLSARAVYDGWTMENDDDDFDF